MPQCCMSCSKHVADNPRSVIMQEVWDSWHDRRTRTPMLHQHCTRCWQRNPCTDLSNRNTSESSNRKSQCENRHGEKHTMRSCQHVTPSATLCARARVCGVCVRLHSDGRVFNAPVFRTSTYNALPESPCSPFHPFVSDEARVRVCYQ
jgi:hypothetical protein